VERPELAGGMLILDESADKKSGSKTVAASRQYNGRQGKVDQCQVGTFLTYAHNGIWTWINGEIFVPERWFSPEYAALLDVCSRLPVNIWYESNPQAHDQSFYPHIQSVLERGMLLIMDLGYLNFAVFNQLTQQGVTFLTRTKINLSYTVVKVLHRSAAVHDRLVWIGKEDTRQQIRLIEVLYKGTWYRYLTNELDPLVLPTAYAGALYWQRWRIEDAFNIVKRLLGLAYFCSGSQNAVELQLWSTWLLYGALVDLTDQVADVLVKPFAALSLEMVYRSLYFFTQAYHRGQTDDLVSYLAQNTQLLGIVKRKPTPSKFSELLGLTSASDP